MKVFVTRRIPEAGLARLAEAGHDVVVSEVDRVLGRDELIARLRSEDPDAVLCLLTDTIDEEALAAAPRARIFANYAVGFDNIDLEAAARRQVAVSNTPDVLTEAVAEFTVALILGLSRHVAAADRFTRAKRYEGWDPLLFLGPELQGKTLGLVGSGRIGGRVAEILQRGFGMSIAYFDRQRNDHLETELRVAFMSTLEELLPAADIVSLHVPLTDGTRHLINGDRLAQMKPTALLINTARGPIVEEAALAAALKDSVIAGAGLDVFEAEPAIDPTLLSLPNVILTPHIASASAEAREKMSLMAAENIIAVLAGKPPLNPAGAATR